MGRRKKKQGEQNVIGRTTLPEDEIRNRVFAREIPRRAPRQPGPRVNSTPASAISVLEVERRLMRGMATLRALPDPEKRFHVVGSAWPGYVRDYMDAFNSSEAVLPRFRPSPFDVSDFLTALSWTRHLKRSDWQILWWRSFGLSFGLIGHYLGRSDETARRRYRDILIDVWCAANNVSAGNAA